MIKDLGPNLELIPGYRLVRYLGRGGFGEVWEAEAPGGISKAIKIANVEEGADDTNCRELKGLQQIRSIRHPFLLSIERFDVIDNFLVIVMELADKSLADRFDECRAEGLVGIPRDELLTYMRESAEALDILNHRFELQHLDVKPENLFLSGGHVKVADFGLVQPRNTNLSSSTIAISPPYAPPELFDGRVEPTADQYGLAVTYQELLTGGRPYNAADIRGLVLQHLRGTPDLSGVSPGDRPILMRALNRDVSLRYERCVDLVEALSRVAVFAPSNTTAELPGLSPLDRPKTVPVRTPAPTEKFGIRKMHVPAKDARHSTTIHIAGRADTISPDKADSDNASEEPTDQVRDTFVAFLPLEIFAHKLRGFIDELGAEIVCCEEDKTVLRLSQKGIFGFRQVKSLFIQLDAYSRDPHSGFRVVDATIWSSNKEIQGRDLSRRGKLLLRYLKAYLMAEGAVRSSRPGAQIRARLFET